MVPGWLFCGCSCWALAPFLVWFVSFGVLLFPSRGKIRVFDRGDVHFFPTLDWLCD